MMHYNELALKGRVFCVCFKYRKDFNFAVLQNACKRSTYFAGNLCLAYFSAGIFFQLVLIKLSLICSVFMQRCAQA